MKKIINVLILVIGLLILILPVYQSFQVNETDLGKWIDIYCFGDWTIIIFIIVFWLSIALLKMIERNKMRILIKSISLITSLLYSIYSILLIIMPIQDFQPSFGIFLIPTIFPLIVILFIIEYQNTKGKKANMEDILDSNFQNT